MIQKAEIRITRDIAGASTKKKIGTEDYEITIAIENYCFLSMYIDISIASIALSLNDLS